MVYKSLSVLMLENHNFLFVQAAFHTDDTKY